MPIEHTLKMPSEAEINAELREMGKYRKEDELNCGSCGYNTCREKAIAVLQGKAEISMCLPYLKDKAESFSDCIVNNTPNGLFVLNENLEVQQINAAARKIMNLRSASDILGEPVVRIMDPAVFLQFCRQNATSATKESTLRNTKNTWKKPSYTTRRITFSSA